MNLSRAWPAGTKKAASQHPNIGPEFLQEPSETDRRGVRDDADLKGPLYGGEFVIADEMICLVTPGGSVRELDRRTDLLG